MLQEEDDYLARGRKINAALAVSALTAPVCIY